MDYDSAMSTAKEDGHEEGLKEGLEEGRLKSQIEIAKKLLLKNINIEEIADITSLSKKEILKIKNNN